ncbi:hypothetical protein CEUSTIGMA_g9767.t1 [Chlamydomonas eustigma]|uniref:Calcineurin-like phosphoesterase domain-containing protein n=1 Tax=Chlamydomonas eustigma TaxID=1157962 RepID=A0A250XGY4_9CHLO|nr:hypothetical protein CEUSTIGMA_g9767.t1 [Chlamydomonas eustigma]|eukprot:GAX82338.1 hypothetical protein CEUSTIGMA_g9767.t1 [Chlamydomonas eustigma]
MTPGLNTWLFSAMSVVFVAAALRPKRIFQFLTTLRPKSCTPTGNKVPPVLHHTLHKAQLKPGRLIIVGDVHGCAAEMMKLLEKLHYMPSNDNLIFTGDLVNKGPQAITVLDKVIEWKALSVRGNHDDSSLQRWFGYSAGNKSLKPQHAWVGDMTPQHVHALENLPFTISIPSYGISVVHAGLVPGLKYDQQDMWSMYKMRNIAKAQEVDVVTARDAVVKGTARAVGKDWYTAEKDAVGGKAWAEAWGGPFHIFFGHDAKRRLQLCPHATGLDTACVYGLQLTAAVIPPLSEFSAEALGELKTKLASGAPITREDLNVQIVSVEAAKAYMVPSLSTKAADVCKE